MVRLGLLLLRWKIEARERAEIIWESRWAGVVFVSCFAVAAACLEYWIPSPGVSVAFMGVAAALLTARIKATGMEKAAWMVLISSFLVIEVLAIRKDRKEHDEALAKVLNEEVTARSEAKNSFVEIGNGIQATIRKSDEHFDATMDRSDRIIAGLGDTINVQTGGDSFAFVTFTPEPNQQFLIAITSHGKYPLREINVTMMDEERRIQAMEEYNKHPGGDWIRAIQAGDTYFRVPYLRPKSTEGPSGDVEVLGSYPFGAKDANDLTIAFSSLNGYWNERLHLRRMDGRWHQALSLMGPTVKQAAHPFIYFDADYPEGKALAEKDWRPTKPQLRQP